MSDRLHLVSHFPGRLRVRADTFRVLPEVAADVTQRLLEEPGVAEVAGATRTGSLVITYDPTTVQLTRIVQLLVRLGGLHGLEVDVRTEEMDRLPRPGARVRDLLGAWDRVARHAMKGNLDLRTAIPGTLAAAGLGILFFGKRRTPEWYDLLFWSFVTFVNLNQPDGTSATRRGQHQKEARPVRSSQ